MPRTSAATSEQQPALAPVGARVSNMLTDFAMQLALAASGAQEQEAVRRAGRGLVTMDVLRALETWLDAAGNDAQTRAEALARVPAHVQRAWTDAEIQLMVWHKKRGLPSPDDADDPGEPTAESADAHVTVPRVRPDERDDHALLVEYLKCWRSVVYFVDNYCYLEDQERGLIPFRLWRWQAWLLYRWLANKKSMSLKARQIGVTELAAALSWWLIRFHDTKTVLAISKTLDDAQALLGRAKVMASHLPVWLMPSSPQRANPDLLDACYFVKDNTETLELLHLDARGAPLKSAMNSMPASQNAGRSRTAALVILDEWAFMMWAAEIWAAVKATAENGGRIIGISTANGMGNFYYRMWTAATHEDTAKRNGFFAAFFSWRRHPRRDAAWYAQQKAEYEAEGHEHLLHQEYPSEPIEAFIQSGRPVFPQELILQHRDRIRAEVASRTVEGLEPWRPLDGLTVYEPPEAGRDYVLGADVAFGQEQGDWDDATVTDRQTGREVAALHGKWSTEEYAARLDELAWRYNKALLAVERQNHGYAVLSNLTQGLAHERWAGERLPYPNLYHYTDELRGGAHEDRRPGWDTNLRTKPLMINVAKRMLRDGSYQPRTLEALDEFLIFAEDEQGRMGAPDGQHDDRVMSRCICAYLVSIPNQAEVSLDFMRKLKAKVDARVAQVRTQQRNVGGRLPRAPITSPATADEASEQESESSPVAVARIEPTAVSVA